jgi:hypothetical protein
MAQTPEGKVKDKVKRLLKKHDCYQFWPVQTGYGAATLDCLGCCNGRYFSIETKAPGKTLTPRQKLTLADMADAGAAVFVVGEYLDDDGEYSNLSTLEAWLIMTKNM